MNLKKTAGGMAASFFITAGAAIIALLPVMLLSQGSYCFLTGLEQTPWFEWLYVQLKDWVLYSQVTAAVFTLFMGAIGAAAWLFIRRYTQSGTSALVGSLLYTLSGYSLVMAGDSPWMGLALVLPILLWGMDKLFLDGRKGWLALGAGLLVVALQGNLIYLFPMLALIFAYFLCRLPSYQPKAGRIFYSLLEWLIGLCLGGIFLLPALYEMGGLMGQPDFWKALTGLFLPGFSGLGTFPQMAKAVLFPPLTEARNGLSVYSLWLPVLGWGGGFALLWSKGHPLGGGAIYSFATVLLMLLLGAVGWCSPEGWGGFCVLPLLVMAACASSAIDGESRPLQIGYTIWMCLTGLTCIAFSGSYALGWLFIKGSHLAWMLGGTVLSGAAGILLVCFHQKKKLAVVLTALVCGVIGGASYYNSWGANPQVMEYTPYTPSAMNAFLDGDKSRMEVPDGYYWLGEYWERPVFSLTGEEDSLAMRTALASLGVYREGGNNYAVWNLLSSRWMFAPVGERVSLTGYEYYGDCGSWKVYQNLYSLPYGVMYDTWMPQETFEEASPREKAQFALKGLVLSRKDYESVQEYLTPIEDSSLKKLDAVGTLTDCYNLAQRKVSGYQPTKDGFTAYSEFEQPGVVFFSLPYSPGLRCTVDGEETPVLRANGGFIAFQVPAGEREIVVERDGGLTVFGGYLSLAALLVWLIVRLVDWRIYRRRVKENPVEAFSPAIEAKASSSQAKKKKQGFGKKKKQGVVEELLDLPPEAFGGEPANLEKQQPVSKAEDAPAGTIPPPQRDLPPSLAEEEEAAPGPKTKPEEMSLKEMQAAIAERKRKNQEEYERLMGKK